MRLLGLSKEKKLVDPRLLAYHTTNFYTYVASTNAATNCPSANTKSKVGTTCVR